MLIDLTKEIKVIRPEGVAAFPYSNSFFIADDIRLMVDAGSGGRAYAPIDPSSVDILALTHNHFDHINGTSFFNNAQIFASEEEAPGYSIPETYYAWAGHKHWEELMGRVKIERISEDTVMPDDIPVKPGFNRIELAGLLKDNEVFDLGKNKLHALHTPGHSHGHYAFFAEREGILFSGDIDIAPGGPWYGGGFSNFDDFINSVNRLIELQPRILVTSHRRVFDGQTENITKLLKDYIGIPLEKESRIYDYLIKPRNIHEITEGVFTTNYPKKTAYIIFWAKMMVKQHLGRLLRDNKIIQLDDDYYVQA